VEKRTKTATKKRAKYAYLAQQLGCIGAQEVGDRGQNQPSKPIEEKPSESAKGWKKGCRKRGGTSRRAKR